MVSQQVLSRGDEPTGCTGGTTSTEETTEGCTGSALVGQGAAPMTQGGDGKPGDKEKREDKKELGDGMGDDNMEVDTKDGGKMMTTTPPVRRKSNGAMGMTTTPPQ